MFHKRRAAVSALVLACLASTAPAHAAAPTTYRVTELANGAVTGRAINGKGIVAGWIAAGSSASAAIVNVDGSITILAANAGSLGISATTAVGWARTATSDQHAVAWSAQGMKDLGALAGGVGVLSLANSVARSGDVVGWSELGAGTGQHHAVSWHKGRIADLGVLPGTDNSEAVAINVGGHIAGGAYHSSAVGSPSTNIRCFLIRDGAMVDLGAFGGPGAFCRVGGMNDHDQVVGSSSKFSEGAYGFDAFIYENGVMTDLGKPRPSDMYITAAGINNHGVAVGSAQGPGQPVQIAFVYDGKSIADLNTRIGAGGAGWVLEDAVAIDDDGVIVGTGTLNGVPAPFLATPIPKH